MRREWWKKEVGLGEGEGTEKRDQYIKKKVKKEAIRLGSNCSIFDMKDIKRHGREYFPFSHDV